MALGDQVDVAFENQQYEMRQVQHAQQQQKVEKEMN